MSQKLLSGRKNVFIGVLHQMVSGLKITKVYTCTNKCTTFMNQCQVVLVSIVHVNRFLLHAYGGMDILIITCAPSAFI